MSDLSTFPQPTQLVLRPGLYQSQNTRGGLNLNNWIKKFLTRIGFAVTSDCCTYYPTVPLIEVANASSPTEDEAIAAGVPPFGMFRTEDGSDIYLWMRPEAGGDPFDFGTNS